MSGCSTMQSLTWRSTMAKKENQTTPVFQPEKKVFTSARQGLLAAVSLLGVSLGASDAAPLDGSGAAASVKDAAAGESGIPAWTCWQRGAWHEGQRPPAVPPHIGSAAARKPDRFRRRLSWRRETAM